MSEEKMKEFFGLNNEEAKEPDVQTEEVKNENIKEENAEHLQEDNTVESSNGDVVQEQMEREETSQEIDTSSMSKIEKEAYDMGWTPKEEFNGDESDFISAKEYVRYGKLQNNLKETKQELDAVKSDVQKQIERAKQIADMEYESKLKDLEEKQKQAVYDADIDAYNEAKSNADKLREDRVNEETYQAPQQKHPLIVEWESKNPWVNDINDSRAKQASELYMNYVNTHINRVDIKTEDDYSNLVKNSLNYVEYSMNIKQKEPEKTVNPMRKAAPATTTRKPVESRGLSMNDLTREERNFWEMTKDSSRFNFTKEEFLKIVEKQRGENNG